MGSGRAEIVALGGIQFLRLTTPPGWRWTKDVQATAGTTLCQQPHLGAMISGRMRIRHGDGTEEEYGPGDLFHIAPNHDGWVVGDEPAVRVDVILE